MPDIAEIGPGRVRLSNSGMAVDVSTSFGPRILHCAAVDGPNMMAQLPEATLEWRPGHDFRLRGGHRLWVAPEVRDVTYTPDDDPVDVAETDGSLILATRATASCPFRRELTLELLGSAPTMRVSHRLTYQGDTSGTAAPWAITMLPADGVVVLPLRPVAPFELQADRNIVLWPYTSLDDPALTVTDDAVIVSGERHTVTKVGTSGIAGWGAYGRAGWALVKRASVDPSARYPDLGAAMQCYANATFCELETLGPLRTMHSGESTLHVETWHLVPMSADPRRPADVAAELLATAPV